MGWPGPQHALSRSLLDQADTIVFDVERRMTDGLPPADVRRLAALLTTCVDNLRSHSIE